MDLKIGGLKHTPHIEGLIMGYKILLVLVMEDPLSHM